MCKWSRDRYVRIECFIRIYGTHVFLTRMHIIAMQVPTNLQVLAL